MPSDLPAPTLISVADMRPRFGFTPKRTYELLATGAIKSALIGRRRFIVLASVEDYIARLAETPTYGRTPNQHPRTAKIVPLVPKSSTVEELSETETESDPPVYASDLEDIVTQMTRHVQALKDQRAPARRKPPGRGRPVGSKDRRPRQRRAAEDGRAPA
jgi:hypothetical protein